MTKREGVTLGNKSFKSKTEAAKYVRKLMESYNHGHYFEGQDYNLVLDLIKRFPDASERIGQGIKNIILQTGIGTDRFFLIERIDGSWCTCGYKGAFFPKNHWTKFCAACREVTANETYGPMTFPGWEKPEGFEVHHVKLFADLVRSFIDVYDIDINKIEYRQTFNRKVVFADNNLERKLMEYCYQFGVVRLLPIDEHKIETAKQEWRKP